LSLIQVYPQSRFHITSARTKMGAGNVVYMEDESSPFRMGDFDKFHVCSSEIDDEFSTGGKPRRWVTNMDMRAGGHAWDCSPEGQEGNLFTPQKFDQASAFDAIRV
jgi:hypothetical protein